MSDEEIGEIVDDSDLVNNEYILIDDFARMIMNRIWMMNLTYINVPIIITNLQCWRKLTYFQYYYLVS